MDFMAFGSKEAAITMFQKIEAQEALGISCDMATSQVWQELAGKMYRNLVGCEPSDRHELREAIKERFPEIY